MKIHVAAVFTVLAGVAVAAQATSPQSAATQAAVDKVFAAWNTATPGCAIGVAENGVPSS